MLKPSVIFVFILIPLRDAAKILSIYPFPSISHQVVFRTLTEELIKRGHEVTVITPDPAYPKGQAPINLTEIDIHDISYKIWTDNFILKGKKAKRASDIVNLLAPIMDAQFQDEALKEFLREAKNEFDLILIEACSRPALVFSYIYKAPVILVSSLAGMKHNYEALGVSVHPTLYPTLSRQRLNNLNIWDKIKEIYNYYWEENVIEISEVKENEIIRKHFGDNVPSLKELSNNVHMLFLNVHPSIEGIRPVPPSVIYMGGLHQKPEKKLPEDLKAYLDSSKNGVIYVSFGTNVDPSLLPAEKIQTFVKVFSQLPYDILWKWNKDELPGRTKNIRIFKWLPQSDLLRHPKIKLFIMQGGLQSTDEAISAEVPMIGIPMLGDQWFNVERYVQLGIGARLDIETLTDEDLNNTINKVIGDESYRQNIKNLNILIHDQPQTPLERAIWWTEYVLRHGGAKHLRGPAANISWAQYLELELVLVLLTGLLTVILILGIAAYFLYKYTIGRYVMQLKLKKS